MGHYDDPPKPAGGRRPSIEIQLPRLPGMAALQVPLNQLILKLDIAEEREARMEATLGRIETALKELLAPASESAKAEEQRE